MSDLIDRQAVIDLLKQMRKDGDMVPWEGKDVFARIRMLPALQLEECTEKRMETHACDLIRRKTGVWLAYTSVPGYMFCKCAACGADILVPYTGRNKPIFNYCPNCGAKMKGEMI